MMADVSPRRFIARRNVCRSRGSETVTEFHPKFNLTSSHDIIDEIVTLLFESTVRYQVDTLPLRNS